MDVQLIKDIPSETQIRKYIKQILFGEHIFCPVCHSRKISKSKNRYWCRTCRIWFSLLSHTWLAHTKLPLQDLWVMLWCFTKQMPIKQTEAVTGLSEKAVRHHFSLFRSQLPQD